MFGNGGKDWKVDYPVGGGNMVFLLGPVLESWLSEVTWSSSSAITRDGRGKGGPWGVIKKFILNAYQQDSIIQSPVKPCKWFLKILLDQPQFYLSSPLIPDSGNYTFRQSIG